MHKTRLVFAAFVSLLATAVFATSSPAAPITIGSPLTAPFGVSACSEPCTVVSTGFNEPGAVVVSPVNGTIVSWRIRDGAPGFNYRLRVLTPLAPFNFTGSGTSAPASPAGPGVQTFSTSLPIKAGQLIGIDLEPGAPIGFLETSPGDTYDYFSTPLLDGQSGEGEPSGGEVAFNAEIRTPPVISGISPASGSFTGGTIVMIAGSELTGATAVSVGSTPATFLVKSDALIEAFMPALPGPGSLPLTVTTPAGSAISPVAFQAQACKVPQLKGKKLKAAKKRTRRALCKVVKVKKIKGATAKTGKVVRQSPRPGKLLAPGARVKITLAPIAPPAK